MTAKDNANKYEDKETEAIKADIRLRFSRSKPYFGKGTAMLLQEIGECGNVRRACENCGFSYSKGWTILNKCEKGLGYKVVDRQHGGENGGTAKVTAEGKKLLAIFNELNKETSDFVERRFLELAREQELEIKD